MGLQGLADRIEVLRFRTDGRAIDRFDGIGHEHCSEYAENGQHANQFKECEAIAATSVSICSYISHIDMIGSTSAKATVATTTMSERMIAGSNIVKKALIFLGTIVL